MRDLRAERRGQHRRRGDANEPEQADEAEAGGGDSRIAPPGDNEAERPGQGDEQSEQPMSSSRPGTSGPSGIPSVSARLSGKNTVFTAISIASVAKTIASTSLCTREAIYAPSSAPIRTKTAQRFTMPTSTAPRR